MMIFNLVEPERPRGSWTGGDSCSSMSIRRRSAQVVRLAGLPAQMLQMFEMFVAEMFF